MTQREFAAKMGLSTTNYGMHESGYVYPGNTKMILAERLLEDYNREIVAKRALANVDLDEDTRTSVLRLYVTGTDPEAIARLLSVDPRVVQLAIAGIDEEEEDSDD